MTDKSSRRVTQRNRRARSLERGVGGGEAQRVLLVMGRASSAASYFEENLGTRRHRTIFVGDKDN